MKKRHAVVVGLDYHAKFLANLVNEFSKTWRLHAYDDSRLGTLRAVLAMRRASALISFGGPGPDAALIELARRRNVPVIVIWAGSDIIKAKENPFELEIVKQEGFRNFAVAPWLVDELRDLGIHAEYVPVAGMAVGTPVQAFPKQFRVLTYLPEPRRDFYGAALVYALARALPDVTFDVVGTGSRSADAPENVVFLGVVDDMPRRIDDTVVLLRQPEHDGTSMLVLEALSRARHVVWNYEFPNVHTARGFDATLTRLRELRDSFEHGELTLNHEGRTFVLNSFGRRDIAARLEGRLDEAVRRQAAIVHRSHRVAISGLGLFCAHVANHAQTVAPDWETRLLRTSSRLEVLTSILTLMNCDVWYSIGSPVTDRWVHLAARLLRKPRVVHWVGSDIESLRENPHLRTLLSSRSATHLAEVAWTAEQLRELGFEPRIAPLPPRLESAACLPLPEKFTIMLYVPRTRSDFYGRRAFERLMHRLKDQPVRYIVVGGGDIAAPASADVVNLGWRDNLRDVYQDVSLLVRYTPHDGLSLMVLEALSFGRHVLWTQQFPFVRTVNSYTDVEGAVREMLDAHTHGVLQPQRAACALIKEQFTPGACVGDIAKAWQHALHADAPAQLAVETS